MVGIVIVSHSQKLAEGVVELAQMMAREVNIAAAGGLEDGMLGTSYQRIVEAIEEVNGAEGAVVLVDMGSAVMTAELAIETLKDDHIRLVDAPLAEGAVLAALSAAQGADLDTVAAQAVSARTMEKISS